ncbi:MAG TPA: hypothetical protein PLI31_09945, partial [Methanoregulaceae archaeon]|nr:hypothetical protein [Methanoregulaceae archaeon]
PLLSTSRTTRITGRLYRRTRDFIRSRLNRSTNDFYSYVTEYAIARHRQIKLVVIAVTKGTSKVE